MYTKINLLLSLLLFLSVFGCDTDLRVIIESEVGVSPDLVLAVRYLPLPDGYVLSPSEDDTSGFILRFAARRWDHPAPVTINERIVDKVWYAPVVRLWDPIQDISELSGGTNIEVLPLHEIALPFRAVSDNGRFPGDPGYPWFAETVVRLNSSGGIPLSRGGGHDALLDWFEAIPFAAPSTEMVRVSAVGDIMPVRGVDKLLLGAYGLATVFTDTLPILRSADLVMGNLEGAVTTRGIRTDKSYTFRIPPEVLPRLRDAGFDYLSLTNNHSFDYGEVGFLDTIANLEESGIKTSGAGTNLESASKPAVFRVGGSELRVLSIGAYPKEKNGFNGMESTSAASGRAGVLWAGHAAFQAIRGFVSDGSFDIVMVHGGEEWSTSPSTEQKKLYRSFIDNGADLVIGSHPHVVHGLEAYKGGLIAYSLGNFIFPGMGETRYGEESLIAGIGIYDNVIRYVQLTPVRIDHQTISVDEEGAMLPRLLEQTRVLNSNPVPGSKEN